MGGACKAKEEGEEERERERESGQLTVLLFQICSGEVSVETQPIVRRYRHLVRQNILHGCFPCAELIAKPEVVAKNVADLCGQVVPVLVNITIGSLSPRIS